MRNSRKLKRLFRIVNLVFWAVAFIVMQVVCYFEWSKFGSYTIASFLTSVFFYGLTFGLFAGIVDHHIVSKK